MPLGKFIVIEGSDGSGKGTQYAVIAGRLRDSGYEVATYDFPQYDQGSSFFAKEYLNGNYGDANNLGAYTPSLFFALDRFHAAARIREDLEAGKIVLSNRFIGSNLAHQGQKIDDALQRKKYFEWLLDLEFEILKIPKPDLNIVLTVPAEIAQKMIDKKAKRSYTDKKRDIHEADINHLRRAIVSYQELCKQFPSSFTEVKCIDNEGKLLSIDDVSELIWGLVNESISSESKLSDTLKNLQENNQVSPSSGLVES